MKVTLLHNTPLHVAAGAIRTCWASQEKSDTEIVCGNCGSAHIDTFNDVCIQCDREYTPVTVCGPNDKALIDRVGNKFKHASTLEHLNYNFFISGVSRALLQELARHRLASYSVKSSRYTLKELKTGEDVVEGDSRIFDWDVAKKFLVMTGDEDVDSYSALALSRLQHVLRAGKKNDFAKYCMPEAYKTELTWSINARSLQNFLSLRSSNAALWEIRELAKAVFEALPEEHKFLFDDSLNKKPSDG